MTTVRMYGPTDVDPHALDDTTVAVIGYGSQGHAHALNLRDSGVRVVVGARADGPSWKRAREAGLDTVSVSEAAERADLIAVLIPDTAQPRVYRSEIEPALRPGKTLLFAHGFNVHYGQVVPPDSVNTVMVAPKSPGPMLRREFEAGQGVPALVSVHHDADGNAMKLTLGYADALGSVRAGVIETTFADETETDLFGEQAVLCGGLTALIRAGFDTLVEAGYAPELAYFECLHEMKLIVDLVYAGGLTGMRERVSDTAEFGDYVSGSRVIGPESRSEMRTILEEIRGGAFAKRWIEESATGGETFEAFRSKDRNHSIERVGRELRTRMSWL